jgi:hypothetical protein
MKNDTGGPLWPEVGIIALHLPLSLALFSFALRVRRA